MQIIVVDDENGGWYLDASTPEAKSALLAEIEKRRVDWLTAVGGVRGLGGTIGDWINCQHLEDITETHFVFNDGGWRGPVLIPIGIIGSDKEYEKLKADMIAEETEIRNQERRERLDRARLDVEIYEGELGIVENRFSRKPNSGKLFKEI